MAAVLRVQTNVTSDLNGFHGSAQLWTSRWKTLPMACVPIACASNALGRPQMARKNRSDLVQWMSSRQIAPKALIRTG